MGSSMLGDVPMQLGREINITTHAIGPESLVVHLFYILRLATLIAIDPGQRMARGG